MSEKRSGYSQRRQSTVSEQSFVGTLAIFVLFFGVYLGFTVGWIVGSLVIVGSIALILQQSSNKQKTEISEFKNRCKELGVIYKPNLSDVERDLFIGVSEEEGKVLMGFRVSDYVVEDNYLDLREVLNVELSINDNSIYKAGPIAALSAAAVGGVAFGGAGAIVGSLTTSHVGSGKIGSLVLKLRMNNIDTPLVQIAFIIKAVKSSSADATARLELAEKWTNLIEVIRYRIAESEPATDKA